MANKTALEWLGSLIPLEFLDKDHNCSVCCGHSVVGSVFFRQDGWLLQKLEAWELSMKSFIWGHTECILEAWGVFSWGTRGILWGHKKFLLETQKSVFLRHKDFLMVKLDVSSGGMMRAFLGQDKLILKAWQVSDGLNSVFWRQREIFVATRYGE